MRGSGRPAHETFGGPGRTRPPGARAHRRALFARPHGRADNRGFSPRRVPSAELTAAAAARHDRLDERQGDAMLVLYFSPGSSSMATHIALHEIGAPFETRLIALSKKEQHRADYLAVNPEGKVPTLLIEGRPLTEVAATLYYLAKTYPAAELWPAGGIEEEAQALSWMSFIASTV